MNKSRGILISKELFIPHVNAKNKPAKKYNDGGGGCGAATLTTSLVDTLLWTEVDGAAGKEMVVLAVVPLVWCVWKIALLGPYTVELFIHSPGRQTIEYLHRWTSSVE